MDNSSKIKAMLQTFSDKPNFPLQGTVTAVDGMSCSVKFASGLVVSDVRLNATIFNGEDFLLLTPKVGSDVTVISLDGTLSNMTVLKFDQIEKFEFSQSGLKVIFDSTDQKVSIANATASLKNVFDDLATLLNAFSVITPSGPSTGLMPPSIAAIAQLQVKYNSLLK